MHIHESIRGAVRGRRPLSRSSATVALLATLLLAPLACKDSQRRASDARAATSPPQPEAEAKSPLIGQHVYGSVWLGPFDSEAAAWAELDRIFADTNLKLIPANEFERGNDFISTVHTYPQMAFLNLPPRLAFRSEKAGFAVEAMYPRNDREDPTGYQIFETTKQAGRLVYSALLRSEVRPMHPDEFELEGGILHVQHRANQSDQPTPVYRYYRPGSALADRRLDAALHGILTGECHEWSDAEGKSRLLVVVDQGQLTYSMSLADRDRVASAARLSGAKPNPCPATSRWRQLP